MEEADGAEEADDFPPSEALIDRDLTAALMDGPIHADCPGYTYKLEGADADLIATQNYPFMLDGSDIFFPQWRVSYDGGEPSPAYVEGANISGLHPYIHRYSVLPHAVRDLCRRPFQPETAM